jgi:hypothetical protein
VSHAGAESIRWEIFLGHLLDSTATRRTEALDSWHVFLDGVDGKSDDPLISVFCQHDTEKLYVTRQILTHAFEAFEESPGVIGTRPTQKWIRELVGTVTCTKLNSQGIGGLLGRLIHLAVVGTSRLPITSLESPLPSFSLGQFSYFPVDLPQSEVPTSMADSLFNLLEVANSQVAARALEFALRSLPQESTIQVVSILRRVGSERGSELLRTVFNQAALAPHTDFASRLIKLVEMLAEEDWFGAERALTLLAFMLRQLCRHLTAFDLAQFHSFGANYPDALFLDALLRSGLRILEAQGPRTHSAGHKLLRRALRAGALLRKEYEGLRVPDSPTSMGENARVLPPPFVRVPEEQITEQGKRRRVLFADTPTEGLFSDSTRPILKQSFLDLESDTELQELGTGLFLDRPIGALKQPGEVDRTPLVSYVAFSRTIADRRLAMAQRTGWIDVNQHAALSSRLSKLTPIGLIASSLHCTERPGVVSLADASKAAEDFVILNSTRSSIDELLDLYDWQPLAERFPALHEWLHKGLDVLLMQQLDLQLDCVPRFEFFRGDQLQFVLSVRTVEGTMAAYREQVAIEVLTPLRLCSFRDDSGLLVELDSLDVLIQAK